MTHLGQRGERSWSLRCMGEALGGGAPLLTAAGRESIDLTDSSERMGKKVRE